MKRIKKEKKQTNFKGYLIGGILSVIVAVAIWLLLILAEQESLRKYDTVERYVFNQDMKAGQVITTSDIFEVANFSEASIPDNVITDIESVMGTYLSTDVTARQLCLQNQFQTLPKREEGTKTISFAVSDASKCVNGTLRPTDMVAIYFVPVEYKPIKEETEYNRNGTVYTETAIRYEKLTKTYEHIFLERVFDGDGISLGNGNTESKALEFQITVNTDIADDIVSMQALGYDVYLIKEN